MRLFEFRTLALTMALFGFTFKSIAADGDDSAASPKSSDSKTVYNYATQFEGGTALYSGKLGSSFASATGYFGSVGREYKTGSFRPFLSLGVDSVQASVPLVLSTNSIALSYTSIKLQSGATIFLAKQGQLLPFLRLAGMASRGSAQVASSPGTDFPLYSRPNIYGYEVSVGFDFRTLAVSTAPSLFRVRMAWSNEIGTFGTISDFATASFRISLGL